MYTFVITISELKKKRMSELLARFKYDVPSERTVEFAKGLNPLPNTQY